MKLFGIELSRAQRRKYPHKVGIALSGGGARGFAHAGALEAMNKVGLKADIVAGVSAGSVVAVMYAAGMDPRDMLGAFSDQKVTDLCGFNMPHEGFMKLDKFKDFLRRTIPYKRLEDLPIPTLVCATNFENGTKEAFTSGDIADVVAASCCIPIVFKPEVIGGQRYVDGGVLANLPAWAIRDECEFLVGLNCSPLSHRRPKDNMVSVALRSYELMSKNNMVQDIAMCDMVVNPDDIALYKAFDLSGIEQVYNSGYRAAMEYFESRGVEVDK